MYADSVKVLANATRDLLNEVELRDRIKTRISVESQDLAECNKRIEALRETIKTASAGVVSEDA